MKKYTPVLVVLLMYSCSLGGLKNQLQDAAALQQIFAAGNCNIQSTNTNGVNSVVVSMMNVGDNKYANLPVNRYLSCVAYEYAQLKSDSLMEALNGVTVSVGSETKKGVFTQHQSRSEHYSFAELQRMDSLFAIASGCVEQVYTAQTFSASRMAYDTLLLPDSILLKLDSLFAGPFALGADKITFFGYETQNEAGMDAVSIEIVNEEYTDVLRFIFKQESEEIIQIDVNPVVTE
jgi:hypothetical protein